MNKKNLDTEGNFVIDGDQILDTLKYRFGRSLNEGPIRLRIQNSSVESVKNERGLKYFQITSRQPLDLVITPKGPKLAIMCVEPAAGYGQSTYSKKAEFFDEHGFAPAGEDEHGIQFAGTLTPHREGMSFSLDSSQQIAKFDQPDTHSQLNNARKIFSNFREFLLKAELLRN